MSSSGGGTTDQSTAMAATPNSVLTPGPPNSSYPTNYTKTVNYSPSTQFSPSMIIIFLVLLAAFFFMGFFAVYIRRCSISAGGDMEQQAGSAAYHDEDEEADIRGYSIDTTDDGGAAAWWPLGGSEAGHGGARGWAAAAGTGVGVAGSGGRGIEDAVIQGFPLVTFASVRRKGCYECVVCLGEFDKPDMLLRQLPKCKHFFHPDCISQWLLSHTTCPICRRSLISNIKSLPKSWLLLGGRLFSFSSASSSLDQGGDASGRGGGSWGSSSRGVESNRSRGRTSHFLVRDTSPYPWGGYSEGEGSSNSAALRRGRAESGAAAAAGDEAVRGMPQPVIEGQRQLDGGGAEYPVEQGAGNQALGNATFYSSAAETRHHRAKHIIMRRSYSYSMGARSCLPGDEAAAGGDGKKKVVLERRSSSYSSTADTGMGTNNATGRSGTWKTT